MRRTTAGAALVSLAVGVVGLAPTASNASSHREAPLIAGDPQADNTDVYAFTSPDKPDTVTLIANWIPFEEPNGGPNFYPFADERALQHQDRQQRRRQVRTSPTRWTFTNHVPGRRAPVPVQHRPGHQPHRPDLNFRQTYTLQTSTGPGGTTTLVEQRDRRPVRRRARRRCRTTQRCAARHVRQLPGGGKTFAGQADDPFFLDLRVFDLLYGGNLTEAGHDTLTGYNVNTLALQVPKSELALNGNATRNPVIGVWSTTAERSRDVCGRGARVATGTFVQVSRLGNPLVNEVVVPLGVQGRLQRARAAHDHRHRPVVDAGPGPERAAADPERSTASRRPRRPRNDLAEIFLTGIGKNAPTSTGPRHRSRPT